MRRFASARHIRPAIARHLDWFRRLLVFALVLPLLTTTTSAETITYDGANPVLQTAPVGGASNPSLIPGAASGNDVTIDYGSGTVPHRVFGGLSDTQGVTGNTVNLIQGTVNNSLYGGYDAGANGAAGNSVTISGGQVGDGLGSTSNGWVLGGYAGSGASFNNTVTISGSAVVNNIDAGESTSGPVTGNKLFITGGQIMPTARAGWSDTGLVSGNAAYMSGGIIRDDTVNFINGTLFIVFLRG